MFFQFRRSNFIFPILIFWVLLLPFTGGTQITTLEWGGTGSSWSSSANWIPSSQNPSGKNLEFKGLGNATSNNNQASNISYRTLLFSGTKLYTITGNLVTLSNPPGLFSLIKHSSTVTQTISAPILFNDFNKFGSITSTSTGALNITGGTALLPGVKMRTELTRLKFAGDFTTGTITLSSATAALSGSSPVEIGINENDEIRRNTRVIFSGNNSGFSGMLSVKAGSLSLRHNSADGTSGPLNANYIDVSNEAALELQGGISLTGKDININGNGVGDLGAIRNVSGNNSISRDIYLANNSRITSSAGTLTLQNIGKSTGSQDWNLLFRGAGNVVVNGTIGAINNGATLAGLLKQEAGVLTIKGKCYLTGGINLSSNGKLQLGDNDLLPSTSNLVLSAGGELRTGGFSQTLGTLRVTGNGKSFITLGAGIIHTLRFANSRAEPWTAGRVLEIGGWSGTVGDINGGTAGKIFVDPDPLDPSIPGLTPTQLAQIQFLPATTYCQGADILPGTNELVPSTKPFIRTVTGQNVPSGTLSFAGFVGSTITVSGCQFQNATGVTVGVTPVTPFTPSGTAMASTVTFALAGGMNGAITVNTPSPGGANTTLTSLANNGYITKANDNFWNTGTTWNGNGVPIANQPVTINNTNVAVTAAVADINTGLPLANSLTINTTSSLKLAGDNFIPANTPLVLAGGSLRLYNGNDDNAPLPGVDQTFDALTLKSSSKIVLGTGSHEIFFGASNAAVWTPGTRLEILNWVGSANSPGTAGRVFVGINDLAGLTPEQLKQIKFTPNCPGATLIVPPDFPGYGELVPSSAPFVASVTSSPGGANKAYSGSTVIIGGCNFVDVNKVEVGLDLITPFNKYSLNPLDPLSDWQIEFKYTANLTDNLVVVSTPGQTGPSDFPLVNLGHISKQDGSWNDGLTWLDEAVPLSNKRVTVQNNLSVDGVANTVSSIEILAGSKLEFLNGSALTVNGSLINRGELVPADGSVIMMGNGGTLSNFGTFESDVFGTVEFLGSGTITGGNLASGLKPITFNNLVMNAGVLTFPISTHFNIPTVNNEFRIKGGNLSTAGGANSRGPIFGANSNLIYSSGATQTRGYEWIGTPGQFSPSYPFNVIIENGTELILRGTAPQTVGPLPLSSNLTLGGDLIIKKGTLNYDLAYPLQVKGDLIVGEGASSIGILRISGDGVDRHLILEGDFIINEQSIFDPAGIMPTNQQPIKMEGNKDAVMENLSNDPSFYNVQINKNGELTLKSPIKILESLNLMLGVVNTTDDYYFQIEGSGLMTGGNIESFVNGPVRKVTAAAPVNASNDFEFKIGGKDIDGNLLYRPVKIANLVPDGLNNTTYTARFNTSETNVFPFDPGPGFIDDKLYGVWKKQWWEVTRTGVGKGRVGINYSELPVDEWTTPPDDGSNVGVVKYSGSSWEFTEDGGFFNNSTFPYPEELPENGAGWVYSALLDNFSPFTIGWGFESVLPIKLLYFSGSLSGNDVLLKWKIADSEDLRHFEVEHSTDGRNFSALGKVLWQENKEYGWRHLSPDPGTHYYRLQMVAKSGARSYSRVEMVQLGENRTIILGLLQNPVLNQQAIVRVYSALPQSAEFSLYDLSGRLLLHTRAQLSAGNNQVPVSVLPLRQANYRLRVRTADGVEKTLSLNK